MESFEPFMGLLKGYLARRGKQRKSTSCCGLSVKDDLLTKLLANSEVSLRVRFELEVTNK